MSRNTEDKDDRMTITVERGEETISFETCPDLHISEFRDLLMRLAAAVGYHQSNIEEHFIGEPEGRSYPITSNKAPSVDMGGNYHHEHF